MSGASGNRTRDLVHAMQALSQLSYGPIRSPRPESNRHLKVLQTCALPFSHVDVSSSTRGENRTPDVRLVRPEFYH